MAETAAAVAAHLNLSASTVKAVADQLVRPAGIGDALGPFVSVRRFAYTDANHYSHTLFTADSSALDGDSRFTANEVRKTVSVGANLPFNRNQRYWTGTGWKTCALQWQVVTTKLGTATTPQTSNYYGGSRPESKVATEDITGKTLREIITKIRLYPLADGVSASTHPISGLPLNWGPSPDLLPADAVFPAGAKMFSGSTRNDIGGVRIELINPSKVRWSDGVYRQATPLEQYSRMAGNLADAAVVVSNDNTVYVADVTLAENRPTPRWRAQALARRLRRGGPEDPLLPVRCSQVRPGRAELRRRHRHRHRHAQRRDDSHPPGGGPDGLRRPRQQARFTQNNRLVSNGFSTHYNPCSTRQAASLEAAFSWPGRCSHE